MSNSFVDNLNSFYRKNDMEDMLATDRITPQKLNGIGSSAMKDWYNLDDDPFSVL